MSSTQKKIGARLKYFKTMAGIPTIIGPGWNTTILSIGPTKNGPKRLAESMNER
jgi:hypothetical protein